MNLKKHTFKAYYLFYIALFFIVTSCGTSTTTDPTPVPDKYLVSSTLIGDYPLTTLKKNFIGYNGKGRSDH